MNAAREKADENRQRFDDLDKQGDDILTQIHQLGSSAAAGSRFYAVKVFAVMAVLVIVIVTLAAWWFMGKDSRDRPASTYGAAMSDVK